MRRWFATLILFSGLWLMAGCATTDEPANRSERPWNAPRSWEHGVPASIMEGR